MDINGFFAKLDAFFAGRDMQAAEAYMKESLNTAEDSGDLRSATAICNELGGYFRKLSRYEEGAALYEKALAYIEQLGLSGSEHHATTLINYATTCTQAGEREKALSFFQKAAEIFAEKGLTADYRVAALHNNISSLYQDAADLPNAEKHLRMALSVLEGLEGTGLEAAITYTNWPTQKKKSCWPLAPLKKPAAATTPTMPQRSMFWERSAIRKGTIQRPLLSSRRRWTSSSRSSATAA